MKSIHEDLNILTDITFNPFMTNYVSVKVFSILPPRTPDIIAHW